MLAKRIKFYLTSILLLCDLYNLRFTQFSMCTLTISIYHELLKVTRFDIVTQANNSINSYLDFFLRLTGLSVVCDCGIS